MTETLDLEFCPFCEGDGRLERTLRDGYADFKDDPDAYAHFVICTSCATQGPWHKTPGNAVRSWNMRPLAEQRQAEVERLRQKLASIEHRFGKSECYYCGEPLSNDPGVDDSHWRSCEKHPAKAEVERLQAANLRMAGVCASQAGELAVLYRENERMTKALAVYADRDNWARHHPFCNCRSFQSVGDGYELAEQALSPVATPPAGDPHSKDGE